MAYTEKRLPERRTIAVRLFSPQMQSVTWSERMPTWSAKKTARPGPPAIRAGASTTSEEPSVTLQHEVAGSHDLCVVAKVNSPVFRMN
ncbi:hypothetical protein [Streptomyces hokutonensis]|uniref:hypothetical protein n=1 Tax=Streptomyces hokutonensis TaxID=1306990 RepID=UPI00037FF2DC